MNRSLLLRIAATLSLVTGLGHTAGTFMPVPPEQTQMHATIATMKATMVRIPLIPATHSGNPATPPGDRGVGVHFP